MLTILAYWLASISQVLFFVFLFWMVKPEYFLFKIRGRVPSLMQIFCLSIMTKLMLHLSVLLLWKLFDERSHYGWLGWAYWLPEWEHMHFVLIQTGYGLVFLLMFWLIFIRGSLAVVPYAVWSYGVDLRSRRSFYCRYKL